MLIEYNAALIFMDLILCLNLHKLKQDMALRQSFQDEHGFSSASLGNFGFELCYKAKLPRQLYGIRPSGSHSCFYDSIILGLNNIKQVHQMIEESGKASNWRLYHIIICDGFDTCSKASWEDVKKTYNQTKNRLRVYEFKTIFIAYNVTPQQYQTMMFLSDLDTNNVCIYPSSFYHNEYDELNLGKLMKRIRKDIGLLFKQNLDSRMYLPKIEIEEVSQNPYGIAEKKFSYGVLFNMSGRSELGGEIWNSICNNYNNFVRYLGDRDILGGIIYTQKPRYFREGEFILQKQKKPVDYNKDSYIPGVLPPLPKPVIHPQPLVDHQPITPPQPPARPQPPLPKPQNTVITVSHRDSMHSQLLSDTQGRWYTINENRSRSSKCCLVLITLMTIAFVGGMAYLVIR